MGCLALSSKALMSWLDTVRRISWSFKISWPDAGSDKCMECGEQRRTHSRRLHRFLEKEAICPKK